MKTGLHNPVDSTGYFYKVFSLDGLTITIISTNQIG